MLVTPLLSHLLLLYPLVPTNQKKDVLKRVMTEEREGGGGGGISLTNKGGLSCHLNLKHAVAKLYHHGFPRTHSFDNRNIETDEE